MKLRHICNASDSFTKSGKIGHLNRQEHHAIFVLRLCPIDLAPSEDYHGWTGGNANALDTCRSHNVACITSGTSRYNPARKHQFDDMAQTALHNPPNAPVLHLDPVSNHRLSGHPQAKISTSVRMSCRPLKHLSIHPHKDNRTTAAAY